MSQNSKKARGDEPRGPGASLDQGTEANGTEQVLARVRELLDAGRPGEALKAIGQANAKSDRLTNAAGVCQLRLGNVDSAVQVFRGLVVAESVNFRRNVPAVFKVNFAAALLAAGNVDGFLSALHEVGDGHPAAGRYRAAYRRWLAAHSPWQRAKMALGGRPPRPFAVDFPPGEV